MVVSDLQKALVEQKTKKKRLQKIATKAKDHDTKPISAANCATLLKEVERIWEDLEEIHNNIQLLETDATKEADHEADHQACEDLFDEAREALVNISAPIASSSTGGSKELNLPKLTLPTFSGNANQWVTFRDMYTRTIHDNTAIKSDSIRFAYLQSCLVGNAAKLINSLPVSDSNYALAWDIIKKRYQNDRELFLTISRKFTSLPVVSADNPDSLRALAVAANEFSRGVDALKIDNQWDAIYLFLISQKLDPASRQFWEFSMPNTDIPTSESLLDFIEQRARSLSASLPIKKSASDHQHHNHKPHAFFTTPQEQGARANQKCKFCDGSHRVFQCRDFRIMPVAERQERVKSSGLCFNCLKSGHSLADCDSDKTCLKCRKRHHTLLHNEKTVRFTASSTSEGNSVQSFHSSQQGEKPYTVLPTAQVRVLDADGNSLIVKAFMDGGSTASFVTESCVNRLGLSRSHSSKEVTGMGEAAVGRTRGITTLRFTPHFQPNFQNAFMVEAFIVKKVTSLLPTTKLNRGRWPHLKNLTLADPTFHVPTNIDIMLGADVFYDLLLEGKKTGPKKSPIATNSKLGWLVGGLVGQQQPEKIQVFSTHIDLHADMQKFWELESVPSRPAYSLEEKACEEHFRSTHTRDSTGRYVVRVPLKTPQVPLGESRAIAVRRLKSVEKRLESKPLFQKIYKDFMKTYLQLGHMTRVPANSNAERIFLPHHYVLKDADNLSKFRVVFDGSAKTSSGFSSNQAQMVGPTIQDSLVSIIMRFRIHPVAFTADISKMYRQVLVAPEDRERQCILWREFTDGPIEEFRLNTATYGTAAAPFLATRALFQLGEDEQEKFPLGAKVVKKDFYVDDCMSGAADRETAVQTIHQLREITDSACFPLRKFASNDPSILIDIPAEFRETQDTLAMDDDDGVVKTLGLHWNTATDDFRFKVKLPESSRPITKRVLLSEISKIFDPMGWLAPTIILSKILMQDVWKEEMEWDELLPPHIQAQWDNLKKELKSLEQLRIPRCISPPDTESLQIHGFSDASKKAYSAAVYVRAKTKSGQVTVSLIAAKSKVAPVKTQSIPRLELCGSLLLAELIKSVQESLELEFEQVKAWTDSTIVLAWLDACPSRWPTFEANRVSKIQEIIPRSSWSHVRSADNPADCASRGILPGELITHSLWWHGPKWLLDEDPIPAYTTPPLQPHEEELMRSMERKTVQTHHTRLSEDSLLSRFSSLTRLKRFTALCQRLAKRARAKVEEKKSSPHSISTPVLLSSPLTVPELEASFLTWVRIMQASAFKIEIKCILASKPIPNSSDILSMNPYLDSDGVLRVGGRLFHAVVPVDRKHPILFPRNHRLTELLILHTHIQMFHGGAQLVHNILNQAYWILHAKDAIKFQLKKCVVCAKRKGELMSQMMGNLPEARVNPSRPFAKTGVDYAGPFLLRAIPPRSKLTFKSYVALFVCFVTRAIHLEVVSALSTEAFIAALRRFTARRGKPSDLYSDCGGNFIGAAKELKELYSLVNSAQHNTIVANSLSAEGISWHFNPPGAPHMGGLWEAGVKSMKSHLFSVLGPVRLTFEELSTTLTQIEACLNSRPLTPLSNNPTDLAALTPAHFLVGDSLFSIPDPDLTTIPVNRLSRWQFVQQLQQHIWRRWSKEFLTRLQQRPKWLAQRKDIEVDDMVLVKSDGLAPTTWPLARVIAIHPGADGLTRVVSLRTANGETKRPIHKLCLLPIDKAPGPVSTTDEDANHHVI